MVLLQSAQIKLNLSQNLLASPITLKVQAHALQNTSWLRTDLGLQELIRAGGVKEIQRVVVQEVVVQRVKQVQVLVQRVVPVLVKVADVSQICELKQRINQKDKVIASLQQRLQSFQEKQQDLSEQDCSSLYSKHLVVGRLKHKIRRQRTELVRLRRCIIEESEGSSDSSDSQEDCVYNQVIRLKEENEQLLNRLRDIQITNSQQYKKDQECAALRAQLTFLRIQLENSRRVNLVLQQLNLGEDLEKRLMVQSLYGCNQDSIISLQRSIIKSFKVRELQKSQVSLETDMSLLYWLYYSPLQCIRLMQKYQLQAKQAKLQAWHLQQIIVQDAPHLLNKIEQSGPLLQKVTKFRTLAEKLQQTCMEKEARLGRRIQCQQRIVGIVDFSLQEGLQAIEQMLGGLISSRKSAGSTQLHSSDKLPINL